MPKKINQKNFNKICKDCFIELNKNNIHKYDMDGAQYVCKKCRKLRDKDKYERRKEIIREQQKQYDLSVKLKVIQAYGEKCICCGENIIEFLTVDNINNCTENNKTGGNFYRWLIKNDFPTDACQILCYNCKNTKDFYGACPHKKINAI